MAASTEVYDSGFLQGWDEVKFHRGCYFGERRTLGHGCGRNSGLSTSQSDQAIDPQRSAVALGDANGVFALLCEEPFDGLADEDSEVGGPVSDDDETDDELDALACSKMSSIFDDLPVVLLLDLPEADHQAWDEDENAEFLDEGFVCFEDIAFEMTGCFLDSAFEQAESSWADDESATTPLYSDPGCVPLGRVNLEHQTEQAPNDGEPKDGSADDRVGEVGEKLRKAFNQAAQIGQLSKLLSTALEQDRLAALKSKIQATFTQGIATGRLRSALAEVTAEQTLAREPSASSRPAATEAPAASSTLLAVSVPAHPEVDSQLLCASGSSQVASAPATPTRTRRRIIGAVVRAPAAQLHSDAIEASPKITTEASTRRKRREKASKKMTKDSSRVFHVVQASHLEESISKSDWTRLAYFQLERPHSKASARLRAASCSAMSMDLGISTTHDSRQELAPPSPGLERKMQPSRSLGSLQTAKLCKLPGAFLPSLPAENASADAIAWTVQMSRSASASDFVGRRSSLSLAVR